MKFEEKRKKINTVHACARFGRACRAHGRVDVFGRTSAHGLVGRFRRAHGSTGHTVRTDVRLDSSSCAHGRVHGSVAMHGLVAMHVRIAHVLIFMDDWAMWLNYGNGHMEQKMAACS